MVARGEDLYPLRSAALHRVQQPGMQALTQKNVAGDRTKHGWRFEDCCYQSNIPPPEIIFLQREHFPACPGLRV
jgi:hypothetical protein